MIVNINGTCYDTRLVFEWEADEIWKQGWYFRPDNRTGYVGAYPTQIAMIEAINEINTVLGEEQ